MRFLRERLDKGLQGEHRHVHAELPAGLHVVDVDPPQLLPAGVALHDLARRPVYLVQVFAPLRPPRRLPRIELRVDQDAVYVQR